MKKRFFGIIFFLLVGAVSFGVDFKAAQAADLKGRIVLQVQDRGQAWYIYPPTARRYYLGRPADAFNVMRTLGLGITNSDLEKFKAAAPRRLAGLILLQVQDQGQAYYVSPLDLRLYYLGRPADAFGLMRSQGLGITNADLALIPIAETATGSPAAPAAAAVSHSYTFSYAGNSYEINENLSAAMYEKYKSSPKAYTYTGDTEPAALREAFYGLFLKTAPGDTALDDLVAKLKAIAANNNWTDDQLVDFTLSFIQSIPYDHAKLAGSGNRNTDPYYPYETLYLDRGVCSDKTFLSVAILRKLGFGAAILDFPDINHSAVGIACPVADSVAGSGYCYGETTNYFPIGVIPQSISSGQAQNTDEFVNLFSTSSLGKIEIYQKSSGRSYTGVAATRLEAAALKSLKDDLASRQAEISRTETDIRSQETALSAMKAQLDRYAANGQTSEYNSAIPAYNAAVVKYNSALADYQSKISVYNQKVAEFNLKSKQFYHL